MIIWKKKLIIVPRVCSSSMFRVSWCVFCSISLLFDYMCMRLPFILWSIAGVSSSQALPGFPYYCASICACSCCTWCARCMDSKREKKHQAQRADLFYESIYGEPVPTHVVGEIGKLTHLQYTFTHLQYTFNHLQKNRHKFTHIS